jgi:VWFA-related protein
MCQLDEQIGSSSAAPAAAGGLEVCGSLWRTSTRTGGRAENQPERRTPEEPNVKAGYVYLRLQGIGCAVFCGALLGAVLPMTAQTAPAQGAGTAASTQSQEANDFTLKAYSRLTVVDVTVVDGKENPVHGLPQSAFTVLEDGKPQPMKSFLEVGKETPVVTRQLPKLPPHIYTNLQPVPPSSSVNVLLMDSLNTTSQDQIFVKQETVNYLKSMQPGTRVAIMTLSSSLRLLQGFTSDPEVLMAALKTKKNSVLPSPFNDTASSDAMDDQADISDADAASAIQQFQNEQASFQGQIKNEMTLEALNQIAAYLAGIKGRKNLIWFAGGFPMQIFPTGGTDDLAGMTDFTRDVRRTTDMLTAAQIAVYPVDARGVMVNPATSVVTPTKGFSNGHGDSMGKSIAEATGGVAYYNTNGLKEAVAKAINNGQNYYSISYVPPDPKFDGIYHKITVKLNVPGARLSYRRGYFSDDVARNEITPGLSLATTAPEPYGNNMQASMGRGVPISGQILFTARVEPRSDEVNPAGAPVIGVLNPKLEGKPLRRYVIQYSLPGQQITFNDGPEKTHKGALEFDIAAYDVYGKVITSLSQSIDLKLPDDRYQQLQRRPFQLEQGLDLPLGEIFLRLGVLDTVSGKVGTLEIPLDVNRKPASTAATSKEPTHP